MVTVDEIKSLQSQVQAIEQELATLAQRSEERTKAWKSKADELRRKSDLLQKEMVKKTEEARKAADQFKSSGLNIG